MTIPGPAIFPGQWPVVTAIMSSDTRGMTCSWHPAARFVRGIMSFPEWTAGGSVPAKIRLQCRLCAEATLWARMTRPCAVPNQANAVPTRPT
jgi:hypothetical protein